jgi:hypothetical protein
MTDSISIEGPVELIDGNLILRILLSVGATNWRRWRAG